MLFWHHEVLTPIWHWGNFIKSFYMLRIFLPTGEMLHIKTIWSSCLMWQWVLMKIYESLWENIEIKRKEEKRCERTESLCDRDDYCAFVRELRATVTPVRRWEVVLVRRWEVRLRWRKYDFKVTVGREGFCSGWY